MRAVATGADHVDQIVGVAHIDPGREFAHDLRRRRDLADGFLLHAQCDGQRRDQHRRQFAAHDLSHQIEHLVVKDLAVLDNTSQGFLRAHWHGGTSLVWLTDAL